MTTTPRNSLDSGEIATRVGTRLWKIVAAVLGVLVVVGPPTIYVVRLPSRTEVALMIQKSAPTRMEHAKVQREVNALDVVVKSENAGINRRMNRLEKMLMRRLDRIDAKLDDLQSDRWRQRQRRKRQSRP